ncbi:MAG: autotransporter-associated beta strand repeat-containing protein [Rhizobiaceae bacterium]|nr:autotransporter-associated beta strand repeat-containing protein [Rhizobiaceae bacterium]
MQNEIRRGRQAFVRQQYVACHQRRTSPQESLSRLLGGASSIALLALGIASSSPALSADITYTGTTAAFPWQFGTAWDGGVVPGAGDRAIIGPHMVEGSVVGSNRTSIGFNTSGFGVLDIGSVWITPDSVLTSFTNATMPALRFHGIDGIAALNENGNVVTFFRRTILADDLVFRASNSAGGGFLWQEFVTSSAAPPGIELNGHTATFDTVNATNTMTFAASSVISGAGNIAKTGAGNLSIGSVSTYTGSTTIAGGTLALVGIGSVASSSRVIADGTFDISALTGAGASIQSLAGGGAVVLGTKDLTITNANDRFSGIISGDGGLTIAAGTQVLAGANTYAGATTVESGATLAAGAANTFSAASAHTVHDGGTLALNGFSQTIAALDNAGRVTLGGAPGTTLTITGDYISNGGRLDINAELGDDGSLTDMVVIGGDSILTGGATQIFVTNLGGAGAATTGDGIKIIDVAGTSAGLTP